MENQQFLNELFEHLNSTILSFEKTWINVSKKTPDSKP
jgi:hypothetical protein